MAVDSIEVNSATGIDGNSYTTSISNDRLTNDDFLKLMLEEMKMQDPTKPMDSAALMDSQLKMSTIESNMQMADSMAALQASYANSALSTAAGLIGKIVENGTIGEDGLQKSYKVDTVENIDGELYVNAKQLTGLIDNLVAVDGDQTVAVKYDVAGNIYENGAITNIKIKLDDDGRFDLDSNNNLVLLDENNNVITNSDIINKYKYNGTTVAYASETTPIAMSSVIKVR